MAMRVKNFYEEPQPSSSPTRSPKFLKICDSKDTFSQKLTSPSFPATLPPPFRYPTHSGRKKRRAKSELKRSGLDKLLGNEERRNCAHKCWRHPLKWAGGPVSLRTVVCLELVVSLAKIKETPRTSPNARRQQQKPKTAQLRGHGDRATTVPITIIHPVHSPQTRVITRVGEIVGE